MGWDWRLGFGGKAMSRIVISFSGGETSAYLSKLMLDEHGKDSVDFVFANTGQEREETLKFIQKFDEAHDLGVTWVESVINEAGKGTSHKIVDFNSADRIGSRFTEMVKKYGIPNQAYPHCTRELKAAPIKTFLDEKYGDDYVIAIGIRYDEKNRHPKEPDKRFIYPLYEKQLRKIDVNVFFEDQPFRLNLHEHQGNCKTCWKKSDVKLAAIYQESPQYFNFFKSLEKEYGLAGHNEDGTPRVFYRRNRSTEMLINDFGGIKPFIDAYRSRLDWSDDEDSGCSESCEPFQAEMFKGYGW